jgi:GNAT superfamily N-acetyltransferase
MSATPPGNTFFKSIRKNQVNAITYRPALDAECPALSDLMLRSKAHWDYDADFIEACRADLTITPEWLRINDGFVAERADAVIGFFGIVMENNTAHVEHFFIAREAIGSGAGKLMWAEFLRQAALRNAMRIEIEAEPHAEAFYRHMGAVTIGQCPSSVFAGRLLPLMELIPHKA